MRKIRMEIDPKKNKVSVYEKKRMSIREQLPYIPHDVILFILHRLPVKSLIRFKTVSKTWNALTTDPNFIRQHHALQPSSKLLLVQRKEKDANATHIYPMPLTFNKSTKSLCAHRNVYQPYESDGSHVLVLGHCFGVFLIVVLDDKKNPDTSYTLCNIATGVTKKVPYLRPRESDVDWYTFGFGCCITSSVPEFKLVKLAYFLNEDFELKCSTHMYTSTTNSWKSVEPCQSKTVKQGTELNGVIHWLAESLTGRRGTNKFILTFDLKKEVFGRIELPHGTRGRGASLAKRDDQCLSLIVPSFDCTDVWVMRYGESWVRQVKLGPSRIDNSTMLGYWHNFKGLLLEDRGEDMGIVMVIGNKSHKYCVKFSETKLFTYVESLISFNF